MTPGAADLQTITVGRTITGTAVVATFTTALTTLTRYSIIPVDEPARSRSFRLRPRRGPDRPIAARSRGQPYRPPGRDDLVRRGRGGVAGLPGAGQGGWLLPPLAILGDGLPALPARRLRDAGRLRPPPGLPGYGPGRRSRSRCSRRTSGSSRRSWPALPGNRTRADVAPLPDRPARHPLPALLDPAGQQGRHPPDAHLVRGVTGRADVRSRRRPRAPGPGPASSGTRTPSWSRCRPSAHTPSSDPRAIVVQTLAGLQPGRVVLRLLALRAGHGARRPRLVLRPDGAADRTPVRAGRDRDHACPGHLGTRLRGQPYRGRARQVPDHDHAAEALSATPDPRQADQVAAALFSARSSSWCWRSTWSRRSHEAARTCPRSPVPGRTSRLPLRRCSRRMSRSPSSRRRTPPRSAAASRPPSVRRRWTR